MFDRLVLFISCRNKLPANAAQRDSVPFIYADPFEPMTTGAQVLLPAFVCLVDVCIVERRIF